MKIETSIGEIVDKLSILQLKKENITEKTKLENIDREYLYLFDIVFSDLSVDNDDYQKLLYINRKLWEIEDNIRIKELKKEFDQEFIQLARTVYQTNDSRAHLKKEMNIKYNSFLIEEKSYQQY